MLKSKRDYANTLRYIQGLLEGERDPIAALANTAAVLKELPGYFWVGFYLVKEDELVLGPFQGPVACTRIAYAKGVCGSAWSRAESILVPDVHAFPGHIACNAASMSELVVPIKSQSGKVVAVLDIDSTRPADFDESDQAALEMLATQLSMLWP